MRIPDSRSIFQLGSYKRIISRFTNLSTRHLSFYISSDKPKCPICIGSYTIDMGIPRETTGGINMHLISLLSAELILWPICALSRSRLSPKSLETSQHGGQGLLSPFYSHLFEFRKFLPLDRSQRRIILFIYICMLIIYNFNNRKKILVL